MHRISIFPWFHVVGASVHCHKLWFGASFLYWVDFKKSSLSNFKTIRRLCKTLFHKCRVDNEILEKACTSQFFNKLAILYLNWTMYGVWISWGFSLQQNLSKKSKSQTGRSIENLLIFQPITYHQFWAVLWLVEKLALFRWPDLNLELIFWISLRYLILTY